MAKYTINHTCGHSSTRDLYGKHTDRENKIAWFAGQDCPQCWAAKKRAAEEATPITATLYASGLDTVNGKAAVQIVLSGNTKPRKDEIRALGYAWTEIRGGLMDRTFGSSRPGMAWVKLVTVDEASIVAAKAELVGVAEKIDSKISVIDVAALEYQEQKLDASAKIAAERDAKIAEIIKPTRPACHPKAMHQGFWNKKYYGKSGSWNYYVDNKRYTLTDAEYAECMAYRAECEKYNAAVNEIKK